jgi:hypothetical protein
MSAAPNLMLLGEAERIPDPASLEVCGGDIIRLDGKPWLWIVYRGAGEQVGDEDRDGGRSFTHLELVRMQEFTERVVVPFRDVVEVVYPSRTHAFAQQQHDAVLEFDRERGAL